MPDTDTAILEPVRHEDFPYPDETLLAPEPVKQVWRDFFVATHISKAAAKEIISDIVERNTILSKFAGKRFASERVQAWAYTASTLGRISDCSHDDRPENYEAKQIATRLLSDYFSQIDDPEEKKYIASFLEDRSEIKSFAYRKIDEVIKAADQPENDNAALGKIFSRDDTASLAESEWNNFETADLSYQELEEMKVNIESQYIFAAELLQNLSATGDNDVATTKKVWLAKAMLAPMLEGDALDGFCSALKNEADGFIYEFSNDETREVAADMARQWLEEFGTPEQIREDISVTVQQMLGISSGDEFNEPAFDDDERFRVIVGDGWCDPPFTEAKEYLRFVWRIKTLMSLASKIIRKGLTYDNFRDEVQDLGALTFLIEDDETLPEGERASNSEDRLVEIFAVVCGNARAHDNLRDIAISGDDQWCTKLLEKLYEHGQISKTQFEGACNLLKKQIDQQSHGGDASARTEDQEAEPNIIKLNDGVNLEVELKGFTVAKITCHSVDQQMPLEMQFATPEQRLCNRYGDRAHPFYKNIARFVKMTPFERGMFIQREMDALGRRRKRRPFVGNSDALLPESLERGEQCLREMEEYHNAQVQTVAQAALKSEMPKLLPH